MLLEVLILLLKVRQAGSTGLGQLFQTLNTPLHQRLPFGQFCVHHVLFCIPMIAIQVERNEPVSKRIFLVVSAPEGGLGQFSCLHAWLHCNHRNTFRLGWSRWVGRGELTILLPRNAVAVGQGQPANPGHRLSHQLLPQHPTYASHGSEQPESLTLVHHLLASKQRSGCHPTDCLTLPIEAPGLPVSSLFIGSQEGDDLSLFTCALCQECCHMPSRSTTIRCIRRGRSVACSEQRSISGKPTVTWQSPRCVVTSKGCPWASWNTIHSRHPRIFPPSLPTGPRGTSPSRYTALR